MRRLAYVLVVSVMGSGSLAAAQPILQPVPPPSAAPPSGSPAMMQPVPPEPAVVAAPAHAAFVTLDRYDGTSIGGLSVEYMEPNTKGFTGDKPTLLRFVANVQYVDKPSGLGGYVQAPFAYARGKTDTGSQTTTAFGDIEAGGIFVPKLSLPDVGLVIHAGITAPTAEDSLGEESIGLFESFGMLRDVYDAIPKGVTGRVGVSPMLRKGNLFVRADLGLDWNFKASKGVDPGKGFHYNLGVGVDLGKVAAMIESANLSAQDDKSSGHGTTFNTLAISVRGDAGAILPYLAVVIPLEEDTSNIYDFAVIAGADFKLPN